MTMPKPGGGQQSMRVVLRTPGKNGDRGLATNALRSSARVVFSALRGKDVGVVQAYTPNGGSSHPRFDSTGNFETIPPYTKDGKTYPLGRGLRGSTNTDYPDPVFTRMLDAQAQQPAVEIDTSWLNVGHVDETIGFVKANTPRGWKLVVVDPELGFRMLEKQVAAGRGQTRLFHDVPADGFRVDMTLADVVTNGPGMYEHEVIQTTKDTARLIDAQVRVLQRETGLADDEIVRLPILYYRFMTKIEAIFPSLVNGLWLDEKTFLAPDPHGPLIGGEDLFKRAVVDALGPLGVDVKFVEDWRGYFREGGDVHCGTNAYRAIPKTAWWESGR